MSDKLVINLHPAILNYSGQPPIRSLRKSVHSSSLCGTNISSSSKSGCITLDYPIPVPYSRIRSSKNSAIFYSKLLRPEGGFADKYPKGAEYSKSSKHSEAYPVDQKGKPDLNGYLTSTIESSLLGGVEFESNCSRIAVNKAKKDRRRPCVLSMSQMPSAPIGAKVLSVLCEA